MIKKPWKNTITKKLGILIIGAALVSAAFFLLLYYASQEALDSFFANSDYLERQEQRSADQLQKFVTDKGLSSQDREEITTWVKKRKILYVTLYKDRVLFYDSTDPDSQYLTNNSEEESYYEWQAHYRVEFSDGSVDAFITGLYEYKFYTMALWAVAAVTFLLFFGILLLGIRRYIRYIQKLEQDVGIIEGGGLDYPITVQGEDELSELAASMENLRVSFKEKNDANEKIYEANKNLVTEMSHDLRTPLTTQILYLELLKNKKFENPEQADRYAEKSLEKAYQMRTLSDHMFEYFLVSKEDSAELEPPASIQMVFYELFSDMSMFLEENGYEVEGDLDFQKDYISVSTDYVVRIFNNIVSNISKYADRKQPVVLKICYKDNNVGILFGNRIRREADKVESTCLGVANIRKMMEKMNGKCVVGETDKDYQMTLWFPVLERKIENGKGRHIKE